MSEAILVSRKRTPCWTVGKEDGTSWIGIDFGANRLFAPTHYALCNGSPEEGWCPRIDPQGGDCLSPPMPQAEVKCSSGGRSVCLVAGMDMYGWALEGYHEGSRQWTMLDPPTPSKILRSPYGVATFPIPPSPTSTTQQPDLRSFRRLRLRSCHPNSRGTHALPICAMEFYGALYETT